MTSPLISVADAKQRILDLVKPVGTEVVPLSLAEGRVLAEDIIAQRTQPPFDVSAMDGYAVRTQDAYPGAQLTVIGATAAGDPPAEPLNPGEAVRIFTGAPTPEGANRIIIQEDTIRDGGRLSLRRSLDSGSYIRRAGLDFTTGDCLVKAPKLLNPRDIALTAAAGVSWICVYRKPRVALIATGNELVWPATLAKEHIL